VVFAFWCDNEAFASSISLITILYFICSNPHQHFYFLVGFAPLEQILRLNDVNVYFILLLISSVKFIILKIKSKFGFFGLICFLILLTQETMLELSHISYGELLIVETTILYFCVFILYSDIKDFNISRIIQNFVSSYIIVIIYVITNYGSFVNFIQMMVNGLQMIRFGQEELEIGGSMGIPLYSALFIAMLLSHFIIQPNLKTSNKICMLAACIGAFFFGVMTISRSFILCMAACMLALTITVFNKQKIKTLKLLLLIIAAGLVTYYIFFDYINSILIDYVFRAKSEEGLGMRGSIWMSCFNYLSEHPGGLIFGFGIKNYVKIGITNGLLFGSMAHNLFIDIIMSTGVLGLVCFIYFFLYLKNKLIRVFGAKPNFAAAIPLCVFLAFGLTALSLNNLKTWIYILMLTIFTYAKPMGIISSDGRK